MTPEQFAYWIQGFAEIHRNAPTDEQWAIIVEHLNTVFKKITTKPNISDALKPKEPPYSPLEDIVGNRWPQKLPPSLEKLTKPIIVC